MEKISDMFSSNLDCKQIIRLEALKQYGGVYLDSDVFIIKGADSLHGFTSSTEEALLI
jgi:mannosyltransferase OCH1-like enzyme